MPVQTVNRRAGPRMPVQIGERGGGIGYACPIGRRLVIGLVDVLMEGLAQPLGDWSGVAIANGPAV